MIERDVPDTYIPPTERRSMGVQSEKFLKDAARGPRRGLTQDKAERKRQPITSGVLDYFPAALAAVAEVSRLGNEQHNPGEPLHWARSKSADHADCIARHLIERGTRDDDGALHSAKLAWRALALLQTELEEAASAPVVFDKGKVSPVLQRGDRPETVPYYELPPQTHRIRPLATPEEVLRRIQRIEREEC